MFLQRELEKRQQEEVAAPEAARWLDGAGLLRDSSSRPGKPLRDLLRAGLIEGAEQRPPAPYGRWVIVRRSYSRASARLIVGKHEKLVGLLKDL